MSSPITTRQVDVLAALAQLDLTPDERELFARQLGDILEYARQVQDIDTTGIPITAGITGDEPADRPDVVQPSIDRAEALANAPDAAPAAGFFRVPRVIG